MHIVAVLGSPRRKGNSTTLAKRLLETAEGLGATTESFTLNELDYKGCQHCLHCKKKGESCILDDGLTPVLAAVERADAVVLASPVYYGDVSGQMKLFIDRNYSFLKPDYPTNPEPIRLDTAKKWVFILAQGHQDKALFADIFPRYEYFLKWFGFRDIRLIRGVGLFKLGDAVRREDLLRQAEDLARDLVGV